MIPPALTSSLIKEQARAFGFDLCGIARAERHPRLARLAEWIARGYAGDMGYLRDSLDERLDPRRVLPTARSVISLACIYNTDAPRSTDAVTPDRAAIARYAWGDDYHDVLRNRMRRLLQWLADEAGPGFEAFSCVDSGPVQERVFAEQAGLGWIGKNSCLINPKLGSWLFLSEIITNAELDADEPGVDQCGTCTRCLDACPTGAIVGPGELDATRCLSYLTIESRGAVDESMRASIGGRVLGCDICQDVCPWNRRAAESDDPAWRPRPGLEFPRLIDLCRMTDDAWRAALRESAMRRAGLRRIRRSLAYATAHLPGDERREALDALSAHASGGDANVAEAIQWSALHDAPRTW
jgi:epoxyqueuosine reductase